MTITEPTPPLHPIFISFYYDRKAKVVRAAILKDYDFDQVEEKEVISSISHDVQTLPEKIFQWLKARGKDENNKIIACSIDVFCLSI